VIETAGEAERARGASGVFRAATAPAAKAPPKGSAELRAMLFEAAHQAARANHPLNPYFRKVCPKHGYRMAVVAVAHRLCRILYSMLKNRTNFDVGKLGVEKGPFRRTAQHPVPPQGGPDRDDQRLTELPQHPSREDRTKTSSR
jgi:hypothetical protein